MLGLAKRIGARFLLTSTSEVYGDPLEHPQKGEHCSFLFFRFHFLNFKFCLWALFIDGVACSFDILLGRMVILDSGFNVRKLLNDCLGWTETYWGNVNPIGVRSCYDEGKRTAETLAMDYHRGADVQVQFVYVGHSCFSLHLESGRLRNVPNLLWGTLYCVADVGGYAGQDCSYLQHIWTEDVHWWWQGCQQLRGSGECNAKLAVLVLFHSQTKIGSPPWIISTFEVWFFCLKVRDTCWFILLLLS